MLAYFSRFSEGFKAFDSYFKGSLLFLLDFKALIMSSVLSAIALFKLSCHLKCVLYAEEDAMENLIKITFLTVVSFSNCFFSQLVKLELLKSLDIVS